MSATEDAVTVVNNAAASRYEIRLDDHLAGFAQYRQDDDEVVLTHTEIGDDYEGQGLGGRLARAAFDDIRERGLRVVTKCPFMAKFVQEHPEYADLVA